jgi:hypothetical protein
VFVADTFAVGASLVTMLFARDAFINSSLIRGRIRSAAEKGMQAALRITKEGMEN